MYVCICVGVVSNVVHFIMYVDHRYRLACERGVMLSRALYTLEQLTVIENRQHILPW